MTTIVITAYRFNNDQDNFAAMTTFIDNDFSIVVDLEYSVGMTKLRELGEKFNKPINTREHEGYTVYEVIVTLP